MFEDARSTPETQVAPESVFSTLISDRYVSDLSYGLATKLHMEPTEIGKWLDSFAVVIKSVEDCRTQLRFQASMLNWDVQLGSFGPSQQLKQKLEARMSEGAGGFAWSINSVVRGLSEIHEKLRLSLEDHLNTDIHCAEIFGKVGDPNVTYRPGDAASS